MNRQVYSSAAILHLGVGNFHRSHQAYAVQRLRESDPKAYAHWGIVGVCFMPSDLPLVEKLTQQQASYHLKMGSPDGAEDLYRVGALQAVLHAARAEDVTEILQRIADPDTKVISLTITEGGYNIDFDQMMFDFANPAVERDLKNREQPQTVFGFLAKGLLARMQKQAGGITLLSCDNILKNGQVLKLALESFLERYDVGLLDWVRAHVLYPNSMVDRITPAATSKDMAEVEKRFGVHDPCLVVAESFFQWVVEADRESFLYPLHRVGVQFVADVDPFEEMKLFILNGGHTLTGLLGDALGHDLISNAVVDPRIETVYDRYVQTEVIPVLNAIEGVSFPDYYTVIKTRFANTLIKDTTARIISGSSDKIPKFILPVIERQAMKPGGDFAVASLIVAAWWHYLDRAYKRNRMADVQDRLRDVWMDLFLDEKTSAISFINYTPVFGDVARVKPFMSRYRHYTSLLRTGALEEVFTSGW